VIKHSSVVRRGVFVGVILTMAATMLSAWPASAAPAAPGDLSPDGTTVSGNPTLEWRPVADATTYNVEVSASATFDTLLHSVTTTNRRVTPVTQLPPGDIWWRVRSVSSAGVSSFSLASMDKNALAGPDPVSPESGAQLQQPDDPPLLTWTPVSGATGYQVEIDGEVDFVDATPYSTQTTSLAVPNPQANGSYFWRVRAVLGTGVNTLWSASRDYSIGPLPHVTVLQPENDADTPIEDVMFDWDPVPGAVTYDLQVDDDDSFSAPIDTKVVRGTRYSPTVTYDNDQYWWRVRARNIFGEAQEWTDVPVRQFRRAWSPAPTLLYPANALTPATGDDLHFQWTPVQLATRYRLDLGSDANFSPGTYESCFTTETTYTPGSVLRDSCMPSPGATNHWRVQALDGPRNPEVNGIYSSSRKFIYDPGRVTQTSPINGDVVDIPTLRWQPAQDAVEYDLRLTWTGGSQTATTKSYSWTPTGSNKLDPTKGPFEWTVQSVDKNGEASPLPFSGERFSISGEIPTTAAEPLTPLSPAPGASASSRFPNLTWEPISNAAYYTVHVGNAGTGFFDPDLADRFPYPAGTDRSSTSLSVTYLQPGSYDWFVTAYDASNNKLDDGDVGTFTVSSLDEVSGQKIALHGSGLDTPGSSCDRSLNGPPDARICTAMSGTPVLDWEPVDDAGYYMIYVSRDREFTNMVYGSKSNTLAIPTTQNTRWNPLLSMADSQAGDAYYWFIRPCKLQGACAPDPTSATHAFDKRSHPVVHTGPLRDATVANDVTFSWTDYLAINQEPGNADEMTGEQAAQAARGYHLQVATTAAFSTIIDDVTVDQTTYTAFTKTYPEGELHWRIQPVDGAGNQLTWSEPWKFTKTSPAVSPLSPVGGASAATTQPFRWEPLNFAASYDLEAYKNNDVTASPTNRVLTATSKQVAYTMADPLPSSDASYVWRVRHVDADNRKGGWSGWSSFKVTGDVPNLAFPAEGTAVNGREALFSWTAVDDAASYRFERRPAGSSGISESQTTTGLAWAPTRTITDGSWQWRVTAIDSERSSLGSTAWRAFTVTSVQPDTTKPTVVSKTPVNTAARRANFVAKFSEPVTKVNRNNMKLFLGARTTPLAGTVVLSADKKTATLNPAVNLKAGKRYTLRLYPRIADLAGNTLTATSWSAKSK